MKQMDEKQIDNSVWKEWKLKDQKKVK